MLSEINTQITNASPEEKKKNKYNKVIFLKTQTLGEDHQKLNSLNRSYTTPFLLVYKLKL